jgi:hypothetical protein
VFVVSVCGEQYRKELILNVTVTVVRGIERGTDTECYLDCCKVLGEGNIERN